MSELLPNSGGLALATRSRWMVKVQDPASAAEKSGQGLAPWFPVGPGQRCFGRFCGLPDQPASRPD